MVSYVSLGGRHRTQWFMNEIIRNNIKRFFSLAHTIYRTIQAISNWIFHESDNAFVHIIQSRSYRVSVFSGKMIELKTYSVNRNCSSFLSFSFVMIWRISSNNCLPAIQLDYILDDDMHLISFSSFQSSHASEHFTLYLTI